LGEEAELAPLFPQAEKEAFRQASRQVQQEIERLLPEKTESKEIFFRLICQ